MSNRQSTHATASLLLRLRPRQRYLRSCFLRRLRRDRYKWGKYVPVIILSNISNPEVISEGTKYTEDYLVKADWSLHDLVLKTKEKLFRLNTNSVPVPKN